VLDSKIEVTLNVLGDIDMTYRLYHFGLCCRNLHKSLDFYQGLGCELIKIFDNEVHRVAFLNTGSKVVLELIENPLMIEEKYFTKRKGSINSISLKVENIYEAYKDMENKNMRIVWKPKEKEGIYQFGLLDEEGMLIKIFNYIQKRTYLSCRPMDNEKVMLKELCLLTSQYEKALALYETALGLTKKYVDQKCSLRNRVSLLGNADESVNESAGILIKEIPDIDNENLKGSFITERERQHVLKYGNGYEHLVFRRPLKDNSLDEEWIEDPDGNKIHIIYDLSL